MHSGHGNSFNPNVVRRYQQRKFEKRPQGGAALSHRPLFTSRLK